MPHSSDKLLSKKTLPSSTSYQENKMIMSFNSGLMKQRQMTNVVSKGHWKLVFESIIESDVDGMHVRMCMRMLCTHVYYI